MELHAVEFEQEVVRELDVGLVDLVDEQHGPRVERKRVPQLAVLDVVAHVRHARIAELAVAQARDGVVLVEPLLGLGGGLDVPGEQRRADALGDLFGQHGFARAGLALHQQRPLQHDGGVDRDLQVLGRHIGLGAGEPRHRSVLICAVIL